MSVRQLLLHFLVLALCFSFGNAATPGCVVWIQKVDTRVLVHRFPCVKPTELNIDNIRYSDEMGNFFLSADVADSKLRIDLLSWGYASIVDESKATDAEKQAEHSARAAHLGIWKSPSPPSQPTDTTVPSPSVGVKSTSSWNLPSPEVILGWLWKALVTLATFSVIQFYVRKWRKERKVQLVLVGHKSAGKTCLLRRIVDGKVSKDVLLNMRPSTGVERVRAAKPVFRGKLEIWPEAIDVAGNAYGEIWDALLARNKKAVVAVLATDERNGNQAIYNIQKGEGVNSELMNIQFAWMQWLAGSLASNKVPKPTIMIIFINKFDMYSNFSSEDSAGRSTKARLEAYFKKHIDVVQTTAKAANVKCEVFFGSAVQDWNIEEMLVMIARAAYPRALNR
jgi:GTPase SAR1 family protein